MGKNEIFQIFSINVIKNGFAKGLGVGFILVFSKQNFFPKKTPGLIKCMIYSLPVSEIIKIFILPE
jgi:hypothetical protein